jgi:hypothetical protein
MGDHDAIDVPPKSRACTRSGTLDRPFMALAVRNRTPWSAANGIRLGADWVQIGSRIGPDRLRDCHRFSFIFNYLINLHSSKKLGGGFSEPIAASRSP